ncbi:MAG: undecaprenyldiphospho-muramoylpentapeptide beta-N-acetylglucosaminyltransferase [Flavobacteriaceae bacterium]|nr:undecaprenyldiphospho-muramoylpentapeptide beta-N-acetylglucosaminyltransferase [Flavobacteriaceae bacterium]
MKQVRAIISGGGTGGHIYPAIAIANELKARHENVEILFVGANDRMEMEKVPQAGYEIKGLWISGLQRKLTFKNMMFPFKVLISLMASRKILRQFKPDIAIGTGGYASGPLLQMANTKGIPTLIQEQNSYPGITNKILSKKAKKICVAYDNLERFFPKDKIVKTGNPVRQDLLTIDNNKAEANQYFKLDSNKKILLVLGGSLGARRVNQFIEKELNFFEQNNVQVIWQTGKLYYEQYQHYEEREGIQTHAFLNRMDLAYTAADIIISRAGASSVSELCIVGKPVVFVPSPNVTEDHQTKNAQAVVERNAAVLIKEKDLESDFEKRFSELLNSEEEQQSLSRNIKELALVNATSDIVDEIEKLIKI